MEPFDQQQAADAAWAFLRNNSTATLKFGEHTQDVSYVICPKGQLVVSAMVAMLQPCDSILFVPEYSDNCMELHVSLHAFKEYSDDALRAVRWQVYHGEPPDVRWATLEIDAARFHEMFIDGESLKRENPLAEIESAVCTELNAHHTDAVRNVCVSRTNVKVIQPFVVGVDPDGVDVRATFGIVRVLTDAPFSSAEEIIAFFSET